MRALGLLLLVGCSGGSKSECIADDMGSLERGWTTRPDCTIENGVCMDDCIAGDGNACFAQALLVQPTDDNKATQLFELACRKGRALGCVNYGAHLYTREIAPTACVLRVFEKTCKVDESFGCAMFGRVHVQHGDAAKGRAILEDSCKRDKGPSCKILAMLEHDGAFGPEDPKHTAELMKLACEGGDDEACDDPRPEFRDQDGDPTLILRNLWQLIRQIISLD